MPVVAGLAAALLVLILVAATGALLLLVLGGALIAGVVRALRRDVDAWLPTGASRRARVGPGTRRSAAGRAEPEMIVIDSRQSAGGATSGERARRQTTSRQDIWVIHPDQTAHWEDEDVDCPQCRDAAA